MNATSPDRCAVTTYLSVCASSKVLLLVPAFGLNICILVSLVLCLLARGRRIRSNVAVFVLGSTGCNMVNLSLWPMTIHWRKHRRWLLGSTLCEVMVGAKQLTGSASFYYVSLIAFSIYLTVVWGCRRLVDSRLFLGLQLIVPLLPVALKMLSRWLVGGFVGHLDPENQSCFTFMNDGLLRVSTLARTAVLLPLNLYFYAHILHTVVRSAKEVRRSQRANVNIAKMFSLISLITFATHVPGAVFSLMEKPSVCQEMVREFLLDLPLLSSPIILFCMNKELRNQGLLLLHSRPGL